MRKPNFGGINRKADHITDATRKFFGQQVPDYIESLPSIKKDSIRWTFNILYFVIGLLFNWAVFAVLQQMPNMHRFPPSVAGMIVLYFLLICGHTVFPKQTDRLVQLIDPYSSFALKSMSVMFVPGFVEIVENAPVSGPELGRMICVFIVAYFIGFMVCTIWVRLLRMLFFAPFWSSKKKNFRETTNESIKMHRNRTMDEEAVQIDNLGITEQDNPAPSSFATVHTAAQRQSIGDTTSFVSTLAGAAAPNQSLERSPSCHELYSPSRNCCTSDTKRIYKPYKPTEKHGPLHSITIWCMKQSSFDDIMLFLLFFICAFVFLPLPEDNPAMPFFRLFLYFTMTLWTFSMACRLPHRIRLVIHPIILCAALVMAGIAYFERVKGFDIRHGVALYKNEITFISLVEKTHVGWPGGGDILAVTMDVSIISLAFNVYKSRPDSFLEWVLIFASIAPVAFLIMFATPLFAHAIGCSPPDSLVWSARSVTTAIGIVIADVLGASQSVVTCIIVFTGIMGPLFGPFLYKLARVSDDDYMTIGITMGSNSHGVGTAYLISKNPKASGVSSLAFAIFGTLGVIVASIPALSDTIRHLSGY